MHRQSMQYPGGHYKEVLRLLPRRCTQSVVVLQDSVTKVSLQRVAYQGHIQIDCRSVLEHLSYAT